MWYGVPGGGFRVVTRWLQGGCLVCCKVVAWYAVKWLQGELYSVMQGKMKWNTKRNIRKWQNNSVRTE